MSPQYAQPLYTERSRQSPKASLRGVERALGIARQTVASWLQKKSTPSPR